MLVKKCFIGEGGGDLVCVCVSMCSSVVFCDDEDCGFE